MNRGLNKDYIFVGIQFVLFVAYLFDVKSLTWEWPLWFNYIGLGIALFGFTLAVIALWQLRNSLSPFPSPLDSAVLITDGVFSRIRHPIYSSVLVAGLGYALYVGSLYKLLIVVLLYILFHLKSGYEEILLSEKYPDYAQYKRNTGRFWPKW